MPRSLRVASKHRKTIESALLRNGFVRQQDFAENLGISRDTVSRFVNGKPVGYLNFYEICERLGLNLEFIADNLGTEDTNNMEKASSLCNLPHGNYSYFIGRTEEKRRLLEFISPEYRQHITIVQGIGGVGKTSLVLETAHQCWDAKNNQSVTDIPIFDAIIFTSAKDTELLPLGLIPRPMKEVTLQEIFRTIARVLNDRKIIETSGEKQIELVYASLAKQITLLIIDNMETIKGRDREDVLSFLNNLPSNVQAVITTREKVILYSHISLKSLSKQESIQLITLQAEEKDINITDEQCKQLYNRFGGVPIGLMYIVGQLASGRSIDEILDPSVILPEDIASFCFDESVKSLRNKPAHKLLMSLAIFRDEPRWQALVRVAGLQEKPLQVNDALAKLKYLSLVYEKEEKYRILPLTREYALSELAKYPNFELAARERWIQYYLEFTEKYGGQDWEDWRIKYDFLEEDFKNIMQVLDWCAANGYYRRFVRTWRNIDNFIDLKGDWDIRLLYWKWLEKQSNQRADWSTYVTALSAQAWTLILKGKDHLKEAEKLIQVAEAIELEEEYKVQACLAICHALFLMRKEKYDEGLKILDIAETFLETVSFEQRYSARYYIFIIYYRAEIYRSPNFEMKDLVKAKNLYLEVCDQAKEINWPRIENYANNDLANIAIQQAEYKEAKRLLDRGLRVAESYREIRRIAHYQSSYWRLKVAQKNLDEAKKWANKALENFSNTFGFIRDKEEIQSWLDGQK